MRLKSNRVIVVDEEDIPPSDPRERSRARIEKIKQELWTFGWTSSSFIRVSNPRLKQRIFEELEYQGATKEEIEAAFEEHELSMANIPFFTLSRKILREGEVDESDDNVSEDLRQSLEKHLDLVAKDRPIVNKIQEVIDPYVFPFIEGESHQDRPTPAEIEIQSYREIYSSVLKVVREKERERVAKGKKKGKYPKISENLVDLKTKAKLLKMGIAIPKEIEMEAMTRFQKSVGIQCLPTNFQLEKIQVERVIQHEEICQGDVKVKGHEAYINDLDHRKFPELPQLINSCLETVVVDILENLQNLRIPNGSQTQLQVNVRARNYVIPPTGSEEFYQMGNSSDHIGIYCYFIYSVDPNLAGKLSFRTELDLDSVGDVHLRQGRTIVFRKKWPCCLNFRNSSKTEIGRCKILEFWVVSPDRCVISTKEVSNQDWDAMRPTILFQFLKVWTKITPLQLPKDVAYTIVEFAKIGWTRNEGIEKKAQTNLDDEDDEYEELSDESSESDESMSENDDSGDDSDDDSG
eukprot:TRINITY_DN2787_c1_g1_i1.p1 TRINITY_DN2787_c1_g1~~TRINITY_DN2787_c1_g1_i1.p1  ORF type:complete len:520 (-),score=149.01 TRINITY_DN2787_c1_g1_i1:34-1593(-)